MKVYTHNVQKDGSGAIKMEAFIPEDFWHIYNLLELGDRVTAKTVRKVTTSRSGDVGAGDKQRKTVVVQVEIEDIDFDSDSCKIRLKGRNKRENKWVPLGSYHTIELAINRAFTLEKKKWDQMHLERVEIASNPDKTAELAVVVMQPGLAHLLLITDHMTICKAKIEVNIPKKRLGSTTRHSKGITRFFKQIVDQIARNVDFEIVKCCVLASPAFVASDFKEFMLKEAMAAEIKSICDNKSKFVLAHTSSGHQQALKEVLGDAEIMAKIGDTKCSKDMRALDRFYKLLNDCPEKAYYGKKHVDRAIEAGAVETLMITDELFRCSDHIQRTEYVKMVEAVRELGAEVLIFSSQHGSGEQLKKITGLAAILRFPMHEIVDEENSDDSSSSDSEVGLVGPK